MATTLALARDLLFASKISSAAHSLHVPIKILRDASQLAEQDGDLLLVDLNQDGAIDATRQWLQGSGRHAIGFVSHTDTQTIAAARAAGITHVLARGRFVQLLPQLLCPPPVEQDISE